MSDKTESINRSIGSEHELELAMRLIRMNPKQIFAIVTPPILVLIMIPVFRILVNNIQASWRVGWALGLAIYWVTWCGIGSWLLIGKDNILQLIQPQRLTIQVFILVLIPIIGAGLYRLVPGMTYEKPALWITLILIMTSFGNGFFEELFWRGVYLELFPKSILWGMIWPTVWFALWHYAPGSVAPDRKPWGLMVGSGMMGIYLSFLARRTGTIWWTILMHTLGGIIMIL
jgi:membrane protease YdiL (CAAX protease family)